LSRDSSVIPSADTLQERGRQHHQHANASVESEQREILKIVRRLADEGLNSLFPDAALDV
jgi:hypothetical protein